MRKYGRVDSNQAQIVAAWRYVGASVWVTSESGNGHPDVVLGYKHKTFLVEIKVPGGKLTEQQKRFHATWNGRPVEIVASVEEALSILGITGTWSDIVEGKVLK